MEQNNLPEVLLISSYPPRECGIATYSHDLLDALKTQFNDTFKVTVCALENEYEHHNYPNQVAYLLDTSDAYSYMELAQRIEANQSVKLVILQHEFGFFVNHKGALIHLLQSISVPVIITFHTVLPNPNVGLLAHIQELVDSVQCVTVMTNHAAHILQTDYQIDANKIMVIAHGTHLVKPVPPDLLKLKYGFEGRFILSTFGLISSGKSIETTLRALPDIIKHHPNVLFLVIGKTHPTVLKHEGEHYRQVLENIVVELKLQDYVQFVNYYLPLQTLLEYLQLTTIYLFTSKDPHQAVSGTFSYAISSGCPIISTPIPHAREVLLNNAGFLVDFEDVIQLKEAVIYLLDNTILRDEMRLNGLHKMACTAWQNSAIAHALLFENYSNEYTPLKYTWPAINVSHVYELTTHFAMIQFAKINRPDIDSGYTVDDNARAMIALCMQYAHSQNSLDLKYIRIYLGFIRFCMQPNGRFLNYVSSSGVFTDQNSENNLDDANGRVVWALGYLVSLENILPTDLVEEATRLLELSLTAIVSVHSTRAIAFAIKGLYYYNSVVPNQQCKILATTLAHRLERMFAHESELGWDWYESYLTYANAVLPEAMLCAYQITGEKLFKQVAYKTFNFLLFITFTPAGIKLISNQSWKHKGVSTASFGEQPIDVAYTILALDRFYEVFGEQLYLQKMYTAFAWFLGHNHLHQIIYNPSTGGCYDGLEEHHVNLNQGAESTLSYLLARLTLEKYTLEYTGHEVLLHEHAYM
jgi:glycosyltransferase involved in cell wall biosynthesis